ncbi:hypothetical protein NQ315_011218 [Exocentrus adspersus]|uniref:Zinc-finger domain-containing protein n=1 Tax=Exocentrus adspersus TaxID=1586481 RepID=A0AAV8VFN0_9CUCU|nr:hypothetical protein NQ315_011218 [Exocentrus adspersus]
MESAASGADMDDREEGEIVDDFEDISDNSIPSPILCGKSVSPKEYLRAVSLSSVSEVDEAKGEEKVHRRKCARKKGVKPHKRRRNSQRKTSYTDSDSDSYLELDKKLQIQLKAAIRVDDTEDRHKNSLRSRLRGMVKLDESDGGTETNVNNNKNEPDPSSDEGDTELAELRLEALRTAVLNKFKHRKKRKMKENNDNDVLSDISVRTDNSETNKENNHNKSENCSIKGCVESQVQNVEITTNLVVENNTPLEDDEDVLRAVLLASMSRKITSDKNKIVPLVGNIPKPPVHFSSEKKETTNIIVHNVQNLPKNRINKNNGLIKKPQLPEVKPLIINVNNDSDSDEDVFNKSLSIDKKIVKPNPTNIEIESTVEKFLKEQRAKVEAKLPPIPKQHAKPKNTSMILEKSCVKLLPKVKQVEYQKLLQKLKNAERKPRIRRSLQKFNGEGRPIAITSKKIVRPKLPLNKPVNTALKADIFPDVKNDLGALDKILKEIQVQKNGSVASKKPEEGRKNCFTSTPVKEKPPAVSFETSPLQPVTPSNSVPITESVPELISSGQQKEEIGFDLPLNPGDPNDIDKIYNLQNTTFPKYISPLDNVKRAVTDDDPFSIVCPYDVDGNCRDTECIYKHLFK